MSRLLITEATEEKILLLTEQASVSLTATDPTLQALIDEIECDLAQAERISGEIYEY